MQRLLLSLLPISISVFGFTLAALSDGRIDREELLHIADDWRSTAGGPGDLTGDGVVDESDVMEVLDRWKKPAGPVLAPEIVVDIPGLPADASPLVVVRIPAGHFMMGRAPGEQSSYPDEDPQHRVDIGSDFYIGKYELTQAQWQTLVGTAPWWERTYVLDYGNGPAVYVSWDAIRAAGGLLDKLNALGQGTFRLPSEAEWEYACRAGTTTRFYWGDDPHATEIGEHAWYEANTRNTLLPYARESGLKSPNAFGLFDMSGNVWEWCEDGWNESYAGAPADGSAWSAGSAGGRVVRGGSWYDNAHRCRSAYRDCRAPGDVYDGLVGVRVVRTLDPPTVSVDSVSIDTFSAPRTWRNGWFSNSGSVSGTGGATVVYHWITRKPDGSSVDSGPLTIPMRDGAGAIPAYPAFPTDQVGRYQSFIRVTSPTLRESPRAFYTITEGGPEELAIDIPGLPAEATPLVMVRIPAGRFMMGRSPGEQDSYYAEDPQHRVEIGYDFYLGKYELTQAQWQALTGTAPWQGEAYVRDDPDGPAVYVWKYDIHRVNGLLDRLNALGQGHFRLPSEAEWEYACRAGTSSRFYWGDDPDYRQLGYFGWYENNAEYAGEK